MVSTGEVSKRPGLGSTLKGKARKKRKKAAFALEVLKERLACFITHASQGSISPCFTAAKAGIQSNDAVFFAIEGRGGR